MFRQRRNNNRNQQRNANTKRRGKNLARTRNGITQRGNGVSHEDNVRQVRKFQVFDNLEFTNASSDYAFGLANFNISPNRSPLKELLSEYTSLYEQYRIRRVRIRAQVGKGYTNDRRLTTIIGARVDVDKQVQGATVANLQSVNCAENAVLRTFTERGNILVVDYRPQNRMVNSYLPPMLPNNLQFFPMGNFDDHRWKGATITAMIPEPSIQPNSLGITLMTEIDVEFRGRITTPTAFSGLTTINQHDEPITYDLEESQDTLRTKLLNGTYFPLSAWPINIGNIGTSVSAEDIIGLTFRRQSDMVHYEIVMYENGNYGANTI